MIIRHCLRKSLPFGQIFFRMQQIYFLFLENQILLGITKTGFFKFLVLLSTSLFWDLIYYFINIEANEKLSILH